MKKRTWKFSDGGAALFVGLLLLPLLTRSLVVVWRRSASGSDGILLACVLLFVALLWLLCVRPLTKQGTWRLARTWYESLFAISIVYTAYATWVLVTGTTPVRLVSVSVPRASGWSYLVAAGVSFAVGSVIYLSHKKRGPNKSPEHNALTQE